MLGLVSYDSDEDGEQQQVGEEAQARLPTPAAAPAAATPASGSVELHTVLPVLRCQSAHLDARIPPSLPTTKFTIPHSPSRPESTLPVPSPALLPTPQPDPEAILGPSLPPQSSNASPYAQSPSPVPPLSPYSHTRSQIHTLTLPHTIPPLPPSPPGTPPQQTSTKFHTFLRLKRTGTHFNQKLVQSSALRNPLLLEKLMGYVGISTDIGDTEVGMAGVGEWSAEQYVSGLDKSIWDYEAWGEGSYRGGFIEELRRSQNEVLEKRQRGIEEDRARGVVRERLGFVGEKGTDFGSGNGNTRGGGVGGRGGGQSKAERAMAGLDQPYSASASASAENFGAGKRAGHDRNRTQPRTRDDRRNGGGSGGGGDEYYRSRDRTREWDRRKINRSRSRSRSRDRDRDRDRVRERYRR
ncbi:hypothetical protein L211DRAFT_850998 [Terfezia boudieri ATCC MYA-4762]|uniref:HCNGP-domain-containing protein n=1 Tax=Terfezia boudieri ATCC MYA-4762 TaxID=1051890 RepID=A0A3N4LKM0_9PEZI|nr:hypothetical protein L211DRAFT_850998 [Terfezia boudieri ATCC MYA-4762]